MDLLPCAALKLGFVLQFLEAMNSACFVNKINDRALTHPDMLHCTQ
jgi:hypothetical protein